MHAFHDYSAGCSYASHQVSAYLLSRVGGTAEKEKNLPTIDPMTTPPPFVFPSGPPSLPQLPQYSPLPQIICICVC